MAGIEIEREYTIGSEWALRFLPPNHFLRDVFLRLEKQIGWKAVDDMMQGYLLVTVGNCIQQQGGD